MYLKHSNCVIHVQYLRYVPIFLLDSVKVLCEKCRHLVSYCDFFQLSSVHRCVYVNIVVFNVPDPGGSEINCLDPDPFYLYHGSKDMESNFYFFPERHSSTFSTLCTVGTDVPFLNNYKSFFDFFCAFLFPFL